jgi:hypothetical protein
MNPETRLWLGVAGVVVLFIGLVGAFWPGETKQAGKLLDGSGVSIKKQNVNRYRAPSNTEWKPNGWLPGVGRIDGHSVDYAFRIWIGGLLIGIGVVLIAILWTVLP